MSAETISHMFSGFDLTYASHLLLSAGLGSALMFGASIFTLRHVLSVNEFLETQIEVQEFRIKEIESRAKVKSDELSRVLEENQSLISLNQELNSEIEASENELNSLGGQLSSVKSELEGVQQENEELVSHAEILSRCVFDGKKFSESTSSFPARVREASGFTSRGGELMLVLNSIHEFHNSWTVGFCKDADGIAAQYYAY